MAQSDAVRDDRVRQCVVLTVRYTTAPSLMRACKQTYNRDATMQPPHPSTHNVHHAAGTHYYTLSTPSTILTIYHLAHPRDPPPGPYALSITPPTTRDPIQTLINDHSPFRAPEYSRERAPCRRARCACKEGVTRGGERDIRGGACAVGRVR